MDLSKRLNESDLDYHKRLITGKLIDKTLNDIDYAELSGLVYGQNYSSDVARRMMYGSARTLQIMEDNPPDNGPEFMAALDQKKAELQIERQKLSDQRAAYNKILREEARHQEIRDAIETAVCSGKINKLQYLPSDRVETERDLLVSLNDIHYGAVIDNYWNTYNPEVCKHLIELYMSKIIDIGRRHNAQDCIIWANGDFISGNIHKSITASNRDNVVKQIMGVSELIALLLARLSEHFKRVNFVSIAGNHSRLGKKDEVPIDERLDDLVEWYLRARLSEFDNVYFDAGARLDPTMYVLDVRGKMYVGVHGDYDGSIDKLLSMVKMAGFDAYGILCGHKHHNKYDNVQGVKVIMAGSFLGMDNYCVEKRIYGYAEQTICVCTENGVECLYDIRL